MAADCEDTPGPELFIVFSHLTGTLLAVGALAVLIRLGLAAQDAFKTVSLVVYGVTLVFLYLASTLYHAFEGKAKMICKRLDYVGIFLLIAGSYTPFTLVALRDSIGWWLFGIVWGLAVVGIVATAVFGDRSKLLSYILFLVMGWLAVIALQPLLEAIRLSGVIWLASGGLFYMVGFVILGLRRIRRNHEVWHVLVMGGSLCHFIAIAFFVA